jgi:hypothetical protein
MTKKENEFEIFAANQNDNYQKINSDRLSDQNKIGKTKICQKLIIKKLSMRQIWSRHAKGMCLVVVFTFLMAAKSNP